MSYRIAAVDVHKKMLAVVVTDVADGGEYQFERRKFGATPGELHLLAQWLVQQEVEEVVMESTAQYWKPVWGALERYWKPARQQAGGGQQDVRHAAPGPSQVQPRAARAKERFRRRRTDDQAAGGAGTGFELRAGSRTAALANGDEAEAPVDARPGAVSRTNWRVCWNRRTSSCRVSCRIFWASVRGAC